MGRSLERLRGWTIAFDLDGTLVDSAPDLANAMNAVLGEDGHAPVPLGVVRQTVGHGSRALLTAGAAWSGRTLSSAELDERQARFLKIYANALAIETRAFDWVSEALTDLEAAGAILCICTNKPGWLSEPLLETLGLRRRFRAVVGAGMASANKPDGRHLLATIACAGGRTDRAVLVGDTDADVGAARSAGTPCLVYANGYSPKPPEALGGDALFETWPEMRDALDRLAEGV